MAVTKRSTSPQALLPLTALGWRGEGVGSAETGNSGMLDKALSKYYPLTMMETGWCAQPLCYFFLHALVVGRERWVGV